MESLEARLSNAFSSTNRGGIDRFGGLSMGESTHLIDEICLIDRLPNRELNAGVRLFVVRECGRYTLPVWVDHVGSAGTRYTTGDLELRQVHSPPSIQELPLIRAVLSA
jgi:CRISPR-associated protein Cas5t